MKITLQNVSKKFGSVVALDRVSLDIEPGQIVTLLGLNGAGKTTLIRCLAGLAAPDDGSVLFDGETLRRDRLDLRSRFYFLPDFPPLFLQLNILRNIAIVLRLFEADLPGREAFVLQLLDEFDLLPLAKKPVGTLSRGQIYKTALVALIAADRDLWLLDEPFASGIDPIGIDTFKRHARDAVARGRIVIYSTQLLDVVERFSTRVCVIHEGTIRAYDTLSNLRAAAADDGDVLQSLFQKLRETANAPAGTAN